MSIPLQELKGLHLIHDHTDAETLAALPKGTPFYLGVDPTAPSLHLGNLVPFMLLVRLARAGLRPVVLFGGATAAIGDPSGRNAERPLLEQDEIAKNIEKMEAQVREIAARCGVGECEFVNNSTWTENLSTLTFLRDIGKHLTVNYMLAKDSVKNRIGGEGISFTEFSYQVLQAFDFFHLYVTKEVALQIGGADQWGNITGGLELIRKKVLGGHAHAISVPLLVDAEGKKFGKSTGGGSLWLDRVMASPFKIHQYLINTRDEDALRYLPTFCIWPTDVITDTIERHQAAPQDRIAQHALADEVVRIIHGDDAVSEARRCASVLFGESFDGISDDMLREIFADVPSQIIPREEAAALSIVDLLVKAGVTPSKGEARRLIQGGGAYLQNNRIDDPAAQLSQRELDRSFIVLRSGKKRYYLVELANS